MNYELAKKLKEAGFPLKWVTPITEKETDYPLFAFNESWCKEPTLSELIEACGEEFESIIYSNKKEWYAYGSSKGVIHDNESRGLTPEEAVANLWLELNKK
jgi:hypothetical protein